MQENNLDLEAIEARCKAASDPPWRALPPTRMSDNWCVDMPETYEYSGVCDTWDDESDTKGERNAAFIAAARTDVPALIAEVRRLRQDIEAGAMLAESVRLFLRGEGNESDMGVCLDAWDGQ